MDEAERCDRVAFLTEGELLAYGTVDELRRQLRGQVLELATEAPRRWQRLLEGLPFVEDVQAFGDKLHALVAGPAAEAALLQALAEAGAAAVPERIEPSLEDVFMYLSRTRRQEVRTS
jgi:ABC-type multidrug transport system ATPase subunit